MRVIIITNHDSNSGSGHFKRCTILAKQLSTYGAEIFFLMGVASKSFINEIRISNHNYFFFGDVFDLYEKIQLINAKLIVIDGYSYDINFELNIKNSFKNNILCVIDDLNRPHFCDYLINASCITSTCLLNVMPNGKSLMGPSFAIIDPGYSKSRHYVSKKNSRISKVLVYFGGVDSKSCTLSVAKMLDTYQMNYQSLIFDVVIGSMNKDMSLIKSLLSSHKNVSFFEGLDNLIGLMLSADLMLGASGSTLWERACLGLPSISACVAENQEINHAYFTKNNLLLSIDKSFSDVDSWNSALVEFISKPIDEFQEMSRQLKNLVDGCGVDRIASALAGDLL